MDPIPLEFPIDFEGKKLTEITMRRARVQDVVNARKGKLDEAEQETKLIATLCGLPPAAILELDLADYKKLQEVLQSFFG